MIFMHRESGVRGAEAKAMMAKFVREVQDTKWEWVREVPKEEAPKIISEPAKVPKPRKSRREPSPFQFEEDPMITLEEPPIKRKKTESFCLEEPLTAEPLGQASPETENNIIKSPSVKIKKKSASKKKETYVNPTERINDKKESDKQTEAGVKEMRNIECDYQTETNVKQTEKLEAKERQEKQTKASENQSENERMKTPVKEKETKSVTAENKTKRKQKDGENQSERTNENKPNKRPANKSVNEMKSVNKIDSDDIIERIMEDISRTHTKCISPISSPRQHNNIPEYDPEEEIKKAVESIMDAPEVKETLESAVEAVSESTSELMMETICEEIMEDVIKEVQEELEVENEADSIMEEGIKRELNTITKEAMLDINLEQLEQKRKAKKAAKRKSGESSKDQDEIERYDNNNNTDIIQSSQEEGWRDTIIEEHRQEEVTDEDDTEDPEEIIRKQREERKIKKNERRKQREIAKLRNILKETQEGRVVLNIGGQRFETSRLTLQQDPDSILSLLFSDDISIRPMGNSYFFDRDPGHFRIILNYLRDGCTARGAILPRERRYLLELKNECIFYRLQGLKDLVDKRLEYLADMYGLDC